MVFLIRGIMVSEQRQSEGGATAVVTGQLGHGVITGSLGHLSASLCCGIVYIGYA